MSAERNRRDEPAAESRALQAGGGGGTSDGMDARVARMEAHVETLRSESAATRTDIADMRVSLATLTERVGASAEGVATLTIRGGTSDERIAILMERVAHLPTKGFVISANMTGIGLLSALILFAEKLKALVGV
jgi:uncharacterized coiled-coil protein SlyX